MNNFTISERLSDDDLYPQLLKLNTTFLFALCSERIPTFLFTCPFSKHKIQMLFASITIFRQIQHLFQAQQILWFRPESDFEFEQLINLS
jgi:hypothetical protein